MSVETIAKQDRAIGVIPAAPWRVAALTVLPGYRLALTFNSGARGEADLSGLVHAPDAGIFAALADEAVFSRAFLDFGAPTWPNGADLDPQWLHEEISYCGIWKFH